MKINWKHEQTKWSLRFSFWPIAIFPIQGNIKLHDRISGQNLTIPNQLEYGPQTKKNKPKQPKQMLGLHFFCKKYNCLLTGYLAFKTFSASGWIFVESSPLHVGVAADQAVFPASVGWVGCWVAKEAESRGRSVLKSFAFDNFILVLLKFY